jgi:hypothetical protein
VERDIDLVGMNPLVAAHAHGNQIVRPVAAAVRPELHVMDLQHVFPTRTTPVPTHLTLVVIPCQHVRHHRWIQRAEIFAGSVRT